MKDHSAEISKILDIIDSNTRFVLTSHINPDGDGLGSELALYYILKRLGKEVRIVNSTPIPTTFNFLDPDKSLFEICDPGHRRLFLAAEVVFVLDISVMHRLGSVADYLEQSPAYRICIDHHASNSFKSEVSLIDTDVVSTGELIFDIMKQGGFELTQDIAEALYISIMTDSGCFRFSNTNARTHEIGAELINAGADHFHLYSSVYERDSWQKAMLFSRAISGIEKYADGRIACMKIPLKMFDETSTVYEDIEGIVEYPRSIGDVQLSVLFIEREDRGVKISFRSSLKVEVDVLASEFGGGGHKNAAAAIIPEKTIDEAADMVIKAAEKYLR